MTPLPHGFLQRPFAHRALHDAMRPENSLSAVRAAVDAGYGIEVDVQPSADGIAMVFHDDTLDRMTEVTGPVTARTAEDLKAIALHGTPDTIPTLADVLVAVGGRVPLTIEVKDQTGALSPDVGPLEEAVARQITGYAGPLAVMSFNPFSVAKMQEIAPDVPRGLVTCDFTDDEWSAASDPWRRALVEMSQLEGTESAFISHHADDLGSPHVARARSHGAEILCWTIRSQAAADAALKIADQITFEGFTPA
ncbi:MAG: glycerophosphodiester phosphodiesterase family protein [Pseudomonadota bacterium]